MEKSRHSIWMPLIGFDKYQEDKGVGEYLDKAGFIPESMSVFLFHSDIVNQHEGMDKEFVLHPDNCSYYGVPANEFRERQPWTNYDLRTLAQKLAERGIDAYLGIMGVYLDNTRHYEWESDHSELLSFGCNGRMNLNVLKRFADGTYYEDFFCDKIVKALDDYGFAGLHVSDFFCPPEHSICNGDFSADMLDQFVTHSHIEYPDEIKARLGFDEQSDIDARHEWIWHTLRQEWIEFYVWRWEKFWGKIATALRAKGKKIMINNAWCADPFEALYRYGIDYKKLYKAGVDIFVAEAVCDGTELLGEQGDVFNKFITMAQLMNAYSPDDKLLALLGVKDCTEEWDILHHAPTRLDRTMHAQASVYRKDKDGYHNSINGYMVTLGDGITEDEWTAIRERATLAYKDLPQEVLCPTLIWSDNEYNAMLTQYINTRRASTHKLMYELKNRNASIGAVARVEDIDKLSTAIIAPNFDLMSEDEQKAILAYKKAPVVGIAPYEYIEKSGIKCDICIKDSLATYELCVFVVNADASAFDGIETEISGEKICECTDAAKWDDPSFFITHMLFRGVSEEFWKVCAKVINAASTSPFASNDAQLLPMIMKDGKYRVYVYNRVNQYKRSKIMCTKAVKSVKAVSKYPVMPVRFVYPPDPNAQKLDGAKADSILIGMERNQKPEGFIAKVPPCGVAIFDVEFE
ncbi:MAG: hypothetical protein IKV73_06260 [Clostridia bacterium]|nr:hypothetical protein [Clostridia bacterium]